MCRVAMTDAAESLLCQAVGGLSLKIGLKINVGAESSSSPSNSNADKSRCQGRCECFGGVECFASRLLPAGCAQHKRMLTASELFGHVAESCGPPPIGVLNRCLELYSKHRLTP